MRKNGGRWRLAFSFVKKQFFLGKKTIFNRFFAFFRVPGGTQVSLKSPEVGPKKRQMGLCGPLGAPGSSRDPFWSHFGCPRGGIWGPPGTPLPPGATFSPPIRRHSIFTNSGEVVLIFILKIEAMQH